MKNLQEKTLRYQEQITETTIEPNEFGQIEKKVSVRTMATDAEPDFVKLYLNDLVKLNNLPKNCSNILYRMLKYLTYDGTITITAYQRAVIAKDLNCKQTTVSQALTTFVQEGILSRLANSTYLVNPYLFGKGSWKNVRGLRLVITYNPDGKTFELIKDQNLIDAYGLTGIAQYIQ